MSAAKLLPQPPAVYSGGQIIFHDSGNSWDMLKLSAGKLRKLRGGKIAYIFQEPSVSLNPVFKIGNQIAEALTLHRPEIKDLEAEVISLLKQVGIPDPESRINCYPHEMSGGMQQRVMIAMALANSPDLLIADEPTTALDVTIQAQILELLAELREKTGMSIIIVTHNLGIVSELADRVIVMYAGNTVEAGPVNTVLTNPRHPYTQALISAVPKLKHESEKLTTIPGTVPSPSEYPVGCRFFGRCLLCSSLPEESQKVCAEKRPLWQEWQPDCFYRCWHV
jgi:oligopeptide/dipeptide ABC transporter ATP-binding protein